MKNDVYLRAAKHIYYGRTRCSCDAIYQVMSYSHLSGFAAGHYESYFAPKPKNNVLIWGDLWGDDDDQRKQCRVLALLFMHWMSQE